MTIDRLSADVDGRVRIAHLIGFLGAFLVLAPIATLLFPAFRALAAPLHLALWLSVLVVGLALMTLGVRLLEEEVSTLGRTTFVPLPTDPAEPSRNRRFV